MLMSTVGWVVVMVAAVIVLHSCDGTGARSYTLADTKYASLTGPFLMMPLLQLELRESSFMSCLPLHE